MKNKFSKKEALFDGWNTFKSNYKILLSISFILIMIALVLQILTDLFRVDNLAAYYFITIILTLISAYIGLGRINIIVNINNNKEALLKDLIIPYPILLRCIGAGLIFGVLVTGGMFVLIIPGIFLAIRYQFYAYLIFDKGLGVTQALEKSFEITRGNFFNLFLLNLFFAVTIGMVIFINMKIPILGILIQGLISLFTALVYFVVYRKLMNISENSRIILTEN